MRVVIPSYNRPQEIHEKTLAYLQRTDWHPEEILILVANQDQFEQYHRGLRGSVFDFFVDLQVTDVGLEASRNFARRNLLTEGEPVIWMDDDIEDVVRLQDDKLVPALLGDVWEDGFQALQQHNLRMWGVAPSANAFYMSEATRGGLYFTIGCFYGEFNDPDPAMDVQFGDSKGDYERSLRHYERHGGVVRMNRYAPVTKYRGNAGGVVADADKVEQNVQALEQQWPWLVQRNPRRKTGVPEILLRERKTEVWS
jgi:cellulose synthase/poly-beta-1,6-N-acetylglucosamine synthase-like glycosyltransferase